MEKDCQKSAQEESLAYLMERANIDMLTGAQNRNAYEDMIRKLEEQEDILVNIGVMLIDVDDMKHINDNFGHEKGDEALKQCYGCIQQAFGSGVDCFRIGGDEFVCIFQMDETVGMEEKMRSFEHIIEEHGRALTYPFSVSVGYAGYNRDTDICFRDVVRRSDTMMYRKKRKKKLMRAAGSTDQIAEYLKKGLVGAIPEEFIFHEKKYQQLPIEMLCAFIDLLSPSTDDYLYVLDFRTDYYYIAPYALQRFSLEENSFHHVIEKMEKCVYGEDYDLLRAEIEDLLMTDRCMHNLVYRLTRVDGKPVWINCRGYVVRDDSNRALYMIGCINEIGARQKADNVSGLIGESGLREYLEKQEPQFPDGYLLRLGLDNFREINEKFGAEYGDMTLRETASCISHCISSEQRLYKLVSDEFMVLDFMGGSCEDAALLYAKVQEALAQFVEDNGYAVIVTISGGILMCSDLTEQTHSNALKYTEFSLSEAKYHGKNRCHVFCAEEYERFLRRRELQRVLRKSINQSFEGFTVHYQPLLRAKDNALFGAEALMRFYSEEYGSIAPGEFIPILEESGLIIPAGRWILKEALETCRKMRKRLPDFQISVNVSHVQVTKTNFLSEITAAIKAAGLPASAVIVELTESGFLEANQDAAKFWSNLDAMGVRLALDDFGTGYANFHYLNEMKPDIIKIDRSFVSKALQDESEYRLLSLLCSMTHKLNLKLCIEGVETKEEWEQIHLLLPDYSQGYYWGKPCPFETFEEQFS